MNFIILHCSYPLVTSTLIGLNIFLSTIFSNTLKLTFFRYAHKVSYPYYTTGIVLCTFIFIFLDNKGEGKDSGRNDIRHFLNCFCS